MGIIDSIKTWNEKRIAQQKSDELWNKLHRYDKDGKPAKFKQKDAIKMARDAVKMKMKKNRDKQQDAKK